MISGMLMLGHVHIYEIMIREIFPTFLQIIDEGNGYRSNESQMMKHQESVLKVDGK